jgi:hypothetical protein
MGGTEKRDQAGETHDAAVAGGFEKGRKRTGLLRCFSGTGRRKITRCLLGFAALEKGTSRIAAACCLVALVRRIRERMCVLLVCSVRPCNGPGLIDGLRWARDFGLKQIQLAK